MITINLAIVCNIWNKHRGKKAVKSFYQSASAWFCCNNKKLQNLSDLEPQRFISRLSLMSAVALILSIIHKERIAPICDITELMAEGKEKWQNHIMALEDAQQMTMPFSYIFHSKTRGHAYYQLISEKGVVKCGNYDKIYHSSYCKGFWIRIAEMWLYPGHVWDRIADKSEDVRERGQELLQCALPLPDTIGPHLLNEQNLNSPPCPPFLCMYHSLAL